MKKILELLANSQQKEYDVVICGQKQKLYQKSISIDTVESQKLFNSLDLYPKVFFHSHKTAFKIITFGTIKTFHNLPKITVLSKQLDNLKCFAAYEFDEKQPQKGFDPWKDFTDENIFLPAVQISFKNGETKLLSQSFDKEAFLNQKLKLCNQKNSLTKSRKLISQEFIPSIKRYKNIFSKLQLDFTLKHLDKVVLARVAKKTFSTEVDAYAALGNLQKNQRNTSVFGWFPKKGKAFLGSSPEHLFIKDNSWVKSFAIAGTGKDKSSLKHSEKDHKEFSFVLEYFKKAFKDMGSEIAFSKEEIIQSNHVYHIYREIKAKIHPKITDETLITTLHPSPAMGGDPKERSKKFLRNHEPFNRGFYSSPLGFFSQHQSEAIVGIRSVLILGPTAYFFSGSGVIGDSKLENEWNELNLKIKAQEEAL